MNGDRAGILPPGHRLMQGKVAAPRQSIIAPCVPMGERRPIARPPQAGGGSAQRASLAQVLQPFNDHFGIMVEYIPRAFHIWVLLLLLSNTARIAAPCGRPTVFWGHLEEGPPFCGLSGHPDRSRVIDACPPPFAMEDSTIVKPRLRLLAALVAALAAMSISTALAAPDGVLLPVPYRSQLDGSAWAGSNCGPASIAMVMQGFGLDVPTQTLRNEANRLLGIADPKTGTRIQDLALVLRQHGLEVTGPYSSSGQFRRWTPDDLRNELAAGHPVVVQTYYPLLPNHMDRPVLTDHYIVIVGFSGDSFIYNDPANGWGPGYRLSMTTAQLMRAWGASNVPFGAFSVAPGNAGHPLLPPQQASDSRNGAPDDAQSTQTPAPSAAAQPAPPAETASSNPAPTQAPAQAAPASGSTDQKTSDRESKSQSEASAPIKLPGLLGLDGLLDRVKSNLQGSAK